MAWGRRGKAGSEKKTDGVHYSWDHFWPRKPRVEESHPALIFTQAEAGKTFSGQRGVFVLSGLRGESRTAQFFHIHEPGPGGGKEGPLRLQNMQWLEGQGPFITLIKNPVLNEDNVPGFLFDDAFHNVY